MSDLTRNPTPAQDGDGFGIAAASVRPEPGRADIAGRLRCLGDIAQDAPDGWTRLNSAARDLVREAASEVDRLTKVADAGMGAIASLAAAISLLERTPKAKKAAPSNSMFDLMLQDYRSALEQARAALSKATGGARV